MPIKYNLTKYDLVAEQIHDLSQKKDVPFSNDEETLKALAIISTSLSPSHSWQTSRTISEGNINLLNSPEVRNECNMAMSGGWKRLRNTDIQEVSRMNIKDNTFHMWLAANANKLDKDTYKAAWVRLKAIFNEECDGITTIQRNLH